MPYTGPGYPNWLVSEYPGLEGVNTALKAFSALANDPGYGQLTASAASDQPAQAYRDETTQGLPPSAGAGLFGRLLAGQMGADVAGQAAQDTGRTSAQKGKISAGQSAADLMASQQESELGLESAQGKQAGQELGAASGGLNLLTNPKGLGGMFSSLLSGGGASTATASSPIFGGADVLGLLSGGGGAAAGGVGGISDLTAAIGGSGGAGGLSDLFATLLEAAPAAAAA
jgi:hypothetical protein